MTVKDILETTNIYTNALILRRKNIVQSILDGDFGKAKFIAYDDVDDLLHGSLSNDVLDLEIATISVEMFQSKPVLVICVEADNVE